MTGSDIHFQKSEPEPPRPPPSSADSPQENPKTKNKNRGEKEVKNSAIFREAEAWKDFIRKHRTDLKKAGPLVDDKPPKLNVTAIYDAEILKAIRLQLKNAFDLNQMMVKTLHEIHIGQGKTDTFSPNYNPKVTNYAARREAAKAIEKTNQLLSKIIKNTNSRMTTVKEYAEQWKTNETYMENNSQFPLFWKVKKTEEAAKEAAFAPVSYVKQYVTEKSAKYPDKRPRVFFEVAIKNMGVVGKMVAILYSDYVPMTVKNFLAFCDPNASLTYKGNLFYLIFQNYYCLTGDVVENRGFGGTSIYGPYFGNEDLTIKHGEKGVLTMFTKIPNRNESKFLICFRKLDSLNGQNVAFGKIIKGLHVLDTIESLGSKKTGRPKVEIYISDCDEI